MKKNQYCLVRTDRAGVFAANVKSRTGSEAVLTDARRLYYWDGAATLSELSIRGVRRPQNCKFTDPVPEQTVLGIIELLPISEEAAKSIAAVPPWRA